MTGWKVYLALVIFRIINVFLIQSQFDPDEYWQNLEPSYCHIFGRDYYDSDNDPASSSSMSSMLSCPGLTWEWKRRRQQNQQQQQYDMNNNQNWSTLLMDFFIVGLEGPVRSFASIVPTLIYYTIIKKYKWDTSWMVSRGPVFINAIFVTAVTDWTVWYMSRWLKPTTTKTTTTMKQQQQQQQDDSNTTTTANNNNNRYEHEKEQKQNDLTFWCVYCSITSWFNAYTLIRTYSNSLETVLLAVSLALVSPVFLSTNQSSNNTFTSSTTTSTTIRAWIAFFLGGICVSIRFTCLTAYIPMGIILALDNNNTIAYLFGICALPGFLGFVSTLLLDKVMYGFWAIPVLGNFHFNVIQGNGSLYGTHPFHWYLTAGIPALTGILLPVLIYDGISKWDRARRNLWTIVLCYVVTHSWSEHKEFRFLLPVLPIFCLLCGGRIQNIVIGLRPSRIKQIMITFAGINLIAILYLGLFHQRAPVDVNRAILKAVAGTHRNNNNNNKPAADIRVHYLMGCHSTPLLSHLHDPPTKFVPWFLDCSPKCRANPDIDCESVAFSNDPGEFMKQTYNFECTATTEEGDQDGTSCAASSTSDNDSNIMGSRTFPDYVVCYSNDIIEMRAHLELMGMKEIGRFVHGINGIRIGNQLTLGDEGFSNNDFTKIGIFRDSLVVSVEEMILFQKYI